MSNSLLSNPEYLLDLGQQKSLEIGKLADEMKGGIAMNLVAPRSCNQREEIWVGCPVIVELEESTRVSSIGREGDLDRVVVVDQSRSNKSNTCGEFR